MSVTVSPPDRRRVIPVQLTSVPLERRLKAADQVCKEADDPLVRIEVMTCAWHPSDRTYWVAA